MIIHPRVNDEDVVILGVDPGDEHVGVAVGCRNYVQCDDNECRSERCEDLDGYHLAAPGWRVYETEEMTPDQFVDWFRFVTPDVDIVTCEKWTLYPDMAQKLTGSEMMASQLIGWIRHTIRIYNQHVLQAGYGKPGIQWEQNPAAIQKPTGAVLKRLGVKPVSPASPDHQRSAELHLWHTLIRNQLVPGVRG